MQILLSYYLLAADFVHANIYWLWLASGVLWLLASVFVSYRLTRKLLGHRRWRGAWYTARQYQELINMLSEDQANGRRVMQHDEMRILREWTQGPGYVGLGLDRRDGY